MNYAGNMIARTVAVLLALALSPAGAAKEPPDCRGTLSGAVKGTFTCSVEVRPSESGNVYLSFVPLERVEGVPGLEPGAFELPVPLAVRLYTLESILAGRAAVYAPGGATYSAYRTTGSKGEVLLTLTRAARDAKAAGGWVVSGTYRARLRPTASPKEDEVIVEVSF
jgi:hypothetical protein